MALARRRAMSSMGKAALMQPSPDHAAVVAGHAADITMNSPDADMVVMTAKERRRAMSSVGKAAVMSSDRTRADVVASMPPKHETDPHVPTAPTRPAMALRAQHDAGRRAAMDRRKRMSQHGKLAVTKPSAQPAQQGRAQSMAVRHERSQLGAAHKANAVVADAATENESGQTSLPHEISTRTNAARSVTGAAYFGGAAFEQDTDRQPVDAASWRAAHDIQVTGRNAGSQLMRPAMQFADDTTNNGQMVTGADAAHVKVTGTDSNRHLRMTGSQYRNPSMAGQNSRHHEHKLMDSGRVSGSLLTGGGAVTGDGSDRGRQVTGDNYAANRATSRSMRATPAQTSVMPMPAHNRGVTGLGHHHAGTTGTSQDQHELMTGTSYEGRQARPDGAGHSMGHAITGMQPGVAAGVTGDARGADHHISGTPYHGEDQLAEAFGYDRHDSHEAQFSVQSPARMMQAAQRQSGHVTGSFARALGKVTGGDEGSLASRHAGSNSGSADTQAAMVTGEGRAQGQKITGDDWARNGRVTGTEGNSARSRNMTRHGDGSSEHIGGLARQHAGKAAERPRPESRITGASGNTDSGSLVTYSGGARG